MPLLRTSKRNGARLRNHLWLAIGSILLAAVLNFVFVLAYTPSRTWSFRWSLATAYVSTVLLAFTLSLGVWRLWWKQPTPVSSDLRRDFGIWCSIYTVVHVVIGLNVHLKSWMQYFLDDAGSWRTDVFGLVNYIGAAATLIVIVLLATSNDFALRKLKTKRWKQVQRWAYVFAGLVALHGLLFIIIDKRIFPFMFIFTAFVILTATIQLAGFQKQRRQHRNPVMTILDKGQL